MTPTRVEFEMTLYNDAETIKKLTLLNCLETMFDDHRNILPPEYYHFSDGLPLGTRIKFTMEIVNDNL